MSVELLARPITLETNMSIFEQIYMGLLLGGALLTPILLNKWWVKHLEKLNDDWAARAEKINKEWGESTKRLLDDQREAMTRVFEGHKKVMGEIFDERERALTQVHEGWKESFKITIDQMEDRYFKFTKKVTDARSPRDQRS